MSACLDRLADLAPEPVAGELRIRVRAMDEASGRRARPALLSARTLGIALFTGLAGVVEAVGDGVVHVAVGDEVFGIKQGCPPTGTGDVVMVDAGQVAHRPAGLGAAEAASLPLCAASAWQMLFGIGRLDRGETALILGAETRTGGMAVQLAALYGVRAVAMTTCASEAALRALGASRVIDADLGRIEAQSRLAGAVVDTVGGMPYRRALEALQPDGVLASCVERSRSTRLKRCVFAAPRVTTASLAQIAALAEAGALKTTWSTGMANASARPRLARGVDVDRRAGRAPDLWTLEARVA